MGPSGSGKTTLLNTLACRLQRGVKVKGDLKLNGRDYTKREMKAFSGYVLETDVVNGMLTVGETLMYTALLRTSPELADLDTEKRITDVLEMMGLSHTRDTLVGTPLIKGISGGERKRLCVAMELLNQPKLIFLDSPTSGLDSVAALSVCTRLKYLASSNVCTVIATIMQPQLKIFQVIDNLLLLAEGKSMYQGAAAGAPGYFAQIGFPCPQHENPADHILDIISDSGGLEDTKTVQPWAATPITDDDLKFGIERPEIKVRRNVPWWKQFAVLCHRNLKNQFRLWGVFLFQLIQALVMGVIIGTIFLEIGVSQDSIRTRQAVLFCCVMNQSVFAALLAINAFPQERMLSLRERAAGTYTTSAYFFAKTAVDILLQLPCNVLFILPAYFLIGFQYTAGRFFGVLLMVILTATASTSVAVTIAAFARTTDLAITVLPFILEVFRLFGGFFKPPSILPMYYSWIDALSFLKYGYVGASLMELNGLEFTCETQNGTAIADNSTCIMTGEEELDELGLDYISFGACVGILFGYIIAMRIIGWQAVRWVNW
eukprot:TRINITY_DN166_c0_g1_i1.p1 TRINITY_DN166_c0_g1~~TRINITY_DN166_c0_g1_i1.p1  ORF type:complete len:632 (+),score=115.84 TRINITY_DN166_c0_g1_i1:262-1896(+)